MKKNLTLGGLLLALVCWQLPAVAQVLTPAIPPNIVTSSPRPMIMLNMSKDHQLFYRAYDEFSDLDADGIPETTYKHSFNYYGYFDSYKCYSYSGTDNVFNPVSTNTTKYCSGNWSGNFLNWATMTRVDVVRKVLYGGHRSTDTASLTILERASLPTDAHSFAKYYRGDDLAQLTPFTASQLASSSTISNNNDNTADRRVQFSSGNNKAYRNNTGGGVAPVGAETGTCESKVIAYYGSAESAPPSYHCITHRVALTTTFSIEVGDQVRAVYEDNTAQYMEGVALEVNTASGWFTMVVAPDGFVNPSNNNRKKWTIQNLTQTSATICNTTLGNNLTANSPFNTNAATNGDSHTNANPPLMRIARGDYQLWNANERWQCHWSQEKSAANGNNVGITGLGAGSSNPSKTAQGVVISGAGPDFIVRVAACASSTLLGTENCKQYPSGNFKPQGLLHEYGEGNLAEFGLMTGSFAKNISGGVLRSNLSSFRSEVNYTTNGTFTATQGIVYTLNKLRIYGYRYSDGTYIGDGDCTFQLTSLTDDKCTSWGNPMGEMFTESLRYLGGLSASSIYDYTQSGSKDAAMGLPKPDWIDPVNRADAAAKTIADATFGQGQCRAINAINFNASVTSYDNNTGTQWDPFATLPTAPSLVNMINVIGTDEGIHDNNWFIGNNGTTNDATCTAKTISTLAAATGLCPDAPSYSGSYALAGAAYWARTNPVRTPSAAQLTANADAFKVKSFSVALSPGKPRIEVPHPTIAGRKVIIQPSYQLLKNGAVGGGTLVDFRVVGTPTATSGKFLVIWEDSEQGGDYDSDVSGILRYEVVGTTLYVYTQVFYEATNQPQGFGYTISGTNKDGAHYHSGIEGYNYTDPTTLTVLRKKDDGTWEANPNVNAAGGCSNCQVSQAESRAEFAFGTSTAGQLEDPLWFAAKWGGFSKNENVTTPPSDPKIYFEKPTADKKNWDIKKLDGTAGADGFPDNYFLAIRPSELEKALRAAFSAIVGASNTAPAVASAQIQTGSLKYLASFDGDDGHGELLTFIVKPDGNFDIRLKADGTLDREYFHWAAHTKLTASTSRQIITNIGNSTGYAFTWAALTNPVKTAAFGGTDATAEAKLNWLRGSRVDEAPNGLRFRKRNANSIMGPVVSSNPTVTAPPSADFFGSQFPGYGTFVTAQRARKSIIWLGAGDGMLHGFDASTDVTAGGTPIISYVPQLLHSRLRDWVEPATEKVQAFIDGTPYSADVLLGSTITNTGHPAYDANAPAAAWRTYLFASLGRGGKGMFALDVTSASSLTEANAASIFKWQFSEADDNSGDLGYNLAQMGTLSRVSQQSGAVAKMNNGKFAALVPNGVNSTNGSAALYIMFANGPYNGVWSPSVNYVKLVADTGPNNGLSQATWVDMNNDGIADYIYAGDIKGNLWKFDVSSTNQADWKVAYANADGTNKRPLFIAKPTDASIDRLPITSAPEYRFHPFGGVIVTFATGKSVTSADFPDGSGRVHGIFGVWDAPAYGVMHGTNPSLLDNATTGLPRLRTQLATRTLFKITAEDADPTNGVVGQGLISGSAVDWSVHKGWFVNFPETSEMVISNPTLTQGQVTFIHIVPAAVGANVCFSGPLAYATSLDPVTGFPSGIFGTIVIDGVTYYVATERIKDQRVTIARDRTAACPPGQNCGRIIGETEDKQTKSPSFAARIYWREIPSFKTR